MINFTKMHLNNSKKIAHNIRFFATINLAVKTKISIAFLLLLFFFGLMLVLTLPGIG